MLLGDYENLMVFSINNSEIVLLGQINQLNQVSWQKQFVDAGEFEITVPVTEENKTLLKKERIIWPGKESAGIIEIVDIEKSEDGERIFTVKGRTLESILERRIINKTLMFKNEHISTILYDIVNTMCINPENEDRIIPFLECAIDEWLGPVVTMQKTGDNVLYTLNEICLRVEDIGFEIQFNPSQSKLIFKVYQASDRTVNQQTNPPVLFSDDTEDILADAYYENMQGMKNIAYVFGEGSGGDRVVVEEGEASSSGFDRFELYVDARDLQQNSDPDNPLSDEEYEEVLRSRGSENLGDARLVQTYEGTLRLADNPQYVYGVDYNLGDKVTVEDEEIGVTVDATVSGITEVVSDTYTAQALFGFGIPKLSRKIKKSLI